MLLRVLGKYVGIIVIAVTLLLPSPQALHAQTSVETGYQDIMSQGIIFAGICSGAGEPCPCRDVGNCQLNDALQIFVNISIFILGISGSLALLMFLYGGFLWITSAGNEKKVQEGKDTITKAVIGLAIIFGAYAFITFIIASLGGVETGYTLEETVEGVTQ